MMLRRLPRIALAILLSASVVAQAQVPPVSFRVKLLPDAAEAGPPGGSTHSGMLSYPNPVQGKANAHVSVSPSATGIEAGATYALTAGSLPDGLDLDPGTGSISGFPAAGGTYAGIVVTATDSTGATASNAFSFAIVEASLAYPSPTAATVGQPLSIAPVPQNLESPFYVRTSGSFPPGVDVDASTGVVSGVPTAAGTFAGIVVYGAGSDGASAVSNGFSITVSPAAQAATASMPSPVAGQVGQALSAYASTSLASPTWSVSAGALPQGLELDASTGEVRGVPASAGTTSGLRLTATEGGQSAQTNVFSIVVQGAPLPTATASMQTPVNGQVGQSLSAVPASSGFQSVPTWSLSAGVLPAGLAVNPSTGAVSGIPTVAGTASGLRLTATAGQQSAQTAPFSIVIAPAPVPPTTAAMATPIEAQVGQALSAVPTSSGFQSAPTWSVTAGALPAWVSLDPATGALSGTPTAVGTTSGIRLTATAGAQSSQTNSFSIVVTAAPVQAAAAMATPIPGQVGQLLSATPSSSGFQSAPSWSLAAGTLPAGLSVEASTGRVYGTPTAAGTASGLVLSASAGGQSAQTNAFSIVVQPAPTSDLALAYPASTTLVRGMSGQSVQPSVTGSSGSVSFARIAGSLPPGMALDPATGAIGGTPTNASTYANLRVRATDSVKTADSALFSIAIVLPSAGSPGSQSTTAGAGFSSPAPSTNIPGATWSVSSGTLPAGLSLNPATGVISGTVGGSASTASGIVLTATGGGVSASTPAFQITVVTVSGPSGGAPTQGTSYTGGFSAPGLGGTVTWSVGSGSLPGGLTLNPSTGVVSGIPTGKGAQPPFTIVATSSNGGTVVSAPVNITVTGYFAESAPGAWTVGQFRSVWLMNFRGTAPSPNPWRFSFVNGGSLPPGLYSGNQFSGAITGTPWQAGTFTGAVMRATNVDTGMVIDSDPLTFVVAPAPGAPLALVQPEGGQIVRVRGTTSYLVAEGDPADPFRLRAGDTFFVRPAITAQDSGLMLDMVQGINIAPWGPTAEMNSFGSRYETGQSLNRYGSISSRAVYTNPGVYPGLTFMVSDTNGGEVQSRTGRVGFIGPFTLKIFDAVNVAPVLSAGALPNSLTPASGSTVLTPGQSADMDFTSDTLGYHVIVYCTPGQIARYSVYSQHPDGSWSRIVRAPQRVCPSGSSQYYEDLTNTGNAGVGKKFRVVVEAGQLAWRGGRIGSANVVLSP